MNDFAKTDGPLFDQERLPALAAMGNMNRSIDEDSDRESSIFSSARVLPAAALGRHNRTLQMRKTKGEENETKDCKFSIVGVSAG